MVFWDIALSIPQREKTVPLTPVGVGFIFMRSGNSRLLWTIRLVEYLFIYLCNFADLGFNNIGCIYCRSAWVHGNLYDRHVRRTFVMRDFG